MSDADEEEDHDFSSDAVEADLTGDFPFYVSRAESREIINDCEGNQDLKEAVESSEEPAHDTDSAACEEVDNVITHGLTSQKEFRFLPQSM